jgi:hypothetical protein
MTPGFLGLPAFAWGGICLLIAAIWAVVYPKDKLPATRGFRWYAMRWGHALTWALLALAQFVRGIDPALAGLADPIALLALPVYLAYLAALFSAKPAVSR